MSNINNKYVLDNINELCLTPSEEWQQKIENYELINGPQGFKNTKYEGREEVYVYEKLFWCRKRYRTFHCCSCKEKNIVYEPCRDRLCWICNKIKKKKYLKKYRSYIATFKDPKFLTLTVKNVHEIGRSYVDKIQKNFTALKRRIKRAGYTLEKGIVVRECTHSLEKGYHLHYHILFDGTNIPWKFIRDSWLEITGGSYIVKIKSVKNNYKKYLMWMQAKRLIPKDFLTYQVDYILDYYYKKNTFESMEALFKWYRITKNMNLVFKLGSDKPVIDLYITIKKCGKCSCKNLVYVGIEGYDDINEGFVNLDYEVETHVWYYEQT